ncbi:MAG: hypothetical protein J0M29_09775 [Chitinophagales bacterium]|nr:hypothetical protein [Chitinophagales bacterium]
MEKVTIEGFHGTGIENIKSILEERFIYTHREDHWLGQGFYFYSDINLALWWIKRKKGVDDGSGCAVIRAVFECMKEQWLDLDTVPGMDYFLSEVSSILTNESTNVSLKFRAGSFSDEIKNLCFALDLLKRVRGIKLIALTFRKDKPTYASESIATFKRNFFPLPKDVIYQERQICCSANAIISSKTVVFPN